MHFGMSGWMKFSNDDTAYYKPQKDKGISDAEWPPKYWKFVLELSGEPKCEVAFVDPRRLARIRLVHVDGNMMRKTPPLSENGPDPVIDKDILTADWLANKMQSKMVPIKALLLDQSCISGVGNWVADEILYQAKLHPEQYCHTFSDEQMKTLHDSLVNVCTTAVDTQADTSKFPENWLMKHRWGKGKSGGDKLPNGDRIIHLKVGGRTSAVVPSVQKKTGLVAADVDDETGEQKPRPMRGQKRPKDKVPEDAGGEELADVDMKEEDGDGDDEGEEEEVKPVSKRAKSTRKKPAKNKDQEDPKPASKQTEGSKKKPPTKKEAQAALEKAGGGRRRSGRVASK